MTTTPSGKPAVVLLSGGLDSTTTLAIALDQGYGCHCLSFRYGQRQTVELERAAAIARRYHCPHLVLNLDLARIGGSALTDRNVAVPKDRPPAEMAGHIPATYVPARNIVFLAHALAWAEVLGAADIFIGANAVDYSGYPDCRPEFLAAFTRMANVGTKAGQERPFTVHAPLLRLSKAEIIQRGLQLGVDYRLTHTCYDPDEQGTACGRCDACQLRRRGFAEAGVPDPLPYQDHP